MLEELINKTKIASKATQIILVYGPYREKDQIRYYHLVFFEKEKGRFISNLADDDTRCGDNGLSRRHMQGDRTTPIGVFAITDAFGFHDIMNVSIPYHKINARSYWGGDSKEWGNYRNRYYEGDHPIDQEEKLDKYFQYEYGLNIGYNYDPVVEGKGSAIFLHCNGKANTAGCVSTSKETMIEIMRYLGKKPYIIIIPDIEELKKY